MRNTTSGLFMLVAVFALILATCQKQTRETEKRSSAVSAATTSPWRLVLAIIPDPPLSGRPVVFRLSMTDTAGKPVTDAHVTAALLMPLMDMGKNEVTFAEKGGGEYEGEGKFTMAGPWNMLVTASAQGKSGQQTFSVAVRE